jgi:flagellar hook-basal body complex protein FliE
MRIEAIVPDTAPLPASEGDTGSFSRALDAFADALRNASGAEDAFAAGSGTLQQAVYERTRADVALSVATATAQRLVQSLQAVLNMQV